jgi:mersacidin/lichenicidin family type 2 lantibiotic
MNVATIIKAWKDEAYRQSLSDAERALLPANPAGLLELTDEDLAHVAGGKRGGGSKSRSGGGGGSKSHSGGPGSRS